MDLDDQVSFCSQTPRLEPISHSTDVTWAGGFVPASSTPQSCSSFLTSFGDFSHKSLGGNRESLQQILLEPWGQHGGQEGQGEQGSWFQSRFQSRSVPAQAVCFTLSQSKESLSVFAGPDPRPVLPRRKFTAWDANAQGFSAEVPDPNQGLFSC